MFSPLNLRAAAVGPGPEIELKPGRRPDWTRAYSDMGRLLPAAETGRLCMADPEPPLGPFIYYVSTFFLIKRYIFTNFLAFFY